MLFLAKYCYGMCQFWALQQSRDQFQCEGERIGAVRICLLHVVFGTPSTVAVVGRCNREVLKSKTTLVSFGPSHGYCACLGIFQANYRYRPGDTPDEIMQLADVMNDTVHRLLQIHRYGTGQTKIERAIDVDSFVTARIGGSGLLGSVMIHRTYVCTLPVRIRRTVLVVRAWYESANDYSKVTTKLLSVICHPK